MDDPTNTCFLTEKPIHLATLDWEKVETEMRPLGFRPPESPSGEFLSAASRFFPTIRDDRSWRALFGVSPNVLGTILTRYYFQLKYYEVTVEDLLMFYCFVCTDLAWDVLGLLFHVSRSTAQRRTTRTRDVLATVLNEISWERKAHQAEEFKIASGPLSGASFLVDGTECQISKPSDTATQHAYNSGKSHTHSIKYEVACHISSGRIMWLAGGDSGSTHDVKVLAKSGLLEFVPIGEFGLADKGYLKANLNDAFFTPIAAYRVGGIRCLSVLEFMYNLNVSSLRIEIERVFGRMKKCFKWLSLARTRNLYEHRLTFCVLAHTFNIMIEFEPLRRELNSYILDPPQFPVPKRTKRSEASLVDPETHLELT